MGVAARKDKGVMGWCFGSTEDECSDCTIWPSCFTIGRGEMRFTGMVGFMSALVEILPAFSGSLICVE